LEIHYKSDIDLPDLELKIAELTDKSVLFFDDLDVHDAFLNAILQLSPNSPYGAIKVKLVIRNILNIRITRNIELDKYHLIFGISFFDNKVYLSSAEELHGDLGLELEAEVSSFDIHLSSM